MEDIYKILNMFIPAIRHMPIKNGGGSLAQNPLLTRHIILAKLSPNLRQDVQRAPHTGSGVHRWLFTTALKLHRHLSPPEIYAVLVQGTAECGRFVSDHEIHNAIVNSAKIAGTSIPSASLGTLGSRDSSAFKKSWPAVDAALIQNVLSQGGSLNLLASGSGDTHPFDPEAVIDHLFPSDALLCCGTETNQFSTLPREAWRGHLRKQQFIVPSPMSAQFGHLKDGSGMSAHTLDNTGPRRFLVVEFDQGTMDQQASLHLHLSLHAPLTVVVFSGSKSLHGWYCCAGENETKIRAFFEYAVRLGADPMTWTRSQFVRMPWGTRPLTQAHFVSQDLLYLNPQPINA